MRKTVTVILASALLTGCATTGGHGAQWEPVVDVRSSQLATYPADLRECQQLATRVMGAGDAAITGAVVGALFGALLGATVSDGAFAGRMAGVGALSGGANAAAHAEGGQRGIISRCLAGRGYSVLN